MSVGTSPPRVLHVVESWRPVPSGYASRSWHVVTRQARHGVSRPAVLVTSRQAVYGEADAAVPDGIPVTVCPPSPRERFTRRLRAFDVDGAALTDAIASAAGGCDLIHVHWSSAIGSAAAAAAERLDLPLVAEVRFDLAGAMTSQTLRDRGGPVERPLRRWFERHLALAGHVIAASHSLARLLDRDLPAARGRTTVVPNGVDVGEPGDGHAIRDRLGVGDSVVVGTTSKMLRYEGLETVAAAAAAVGGRALFVGDGPERERLKAVTKRIGGTADFVGRVPAAAIPDHLAAIDVFAVPRRATTITRFASPIKVTEAMAAGRAVVATDVGDVGDLLAGGRGLAVPPGDRDAFLAATRRLADEPETRASLGAAAREWVCRELPWEKVVARYADVYREVLR